MSYLDRDDIEARIPPSHITEALDDDGDSVEDAGLWEKIASTVAAEIDGYLSRRYALPLIDPPASLRSAAASLACELLYQRRGISAETNPHTKSAAEARSWLASIASGKTSLAIATAPARGPISIIKEPAGTVPTGRLNG